MKKYILVSMMIVSMFTFNGCVSSSIEEDDSREYNDGMVSLFLIDQDGLSAGDVPYSCVDENNNLIGQWVTKSNGEFNFYVGETCTFDLFGYNGTPDDPLYIEDDIGSGQEDILYECEQGDSGLTTIYGGFDYLQDDRCTFYF